MRVLVACECSNTVRDAFLRRGHDAYSCDIQHADRPNKNWKRHIRGDVRPLLRERWDLVIAHPPCTYLSIVSGIHFKAGMPPEESNPQRYVKLLAGVQFFWDCFEANADKIVCENPIPNGHSREFLGDYTQIIQPWQFGHPYTKATCLWLKGLPKLQPTNIVKPTRPWVYLSGCNNYYNKGEAKNSKTRSKTFAGIAQAMAEQWG